MATLQAKKRAAASAVVKKAKKHKQENSPKITATFYTSDPNDDHLQIERYRMKDVADLIRLLCDNYYMQHVEEARIEFK